MTAQTINFKTIADDFQTLALRHKQINSYGLGDVDQLSYWTQMRDKEDNPTFESPVFPLLYVVPSKVENDLRYKTWELNTVMMDIVDRDLANQVDVLSDTLQTLQDVVSQFRLSVTAQEGNYNNKYYLDDSVDFTPFLEKYSDLTNGWNANIKIKTISPLDRCAAAYTTFTGTPITHSNINFKTFHDDFRLLADHHKQVNSFGFGSYEDLSYWTESRLKADNPTFESAFFPLMYVVPSNATQIINDNGSSFTEYEFNVVVMDILDRDLANQVDVLSDTNQILDDIISQFRLSVSDSLGNFNRYYYLDDIVICTPFLEKFSDLCGGWSGLLRIQVATPLDRCDAAFDSFISPTPTPTATNTPTPSITPTNTVTPTNTPTNTPSLTPSETPTNTPTITPTITPTSTCPITTQYMESVVVGGDKIRLSLWSDPGYSVSDVALCDYVVSGMMQGSSGTTYYGDRTFPVGDHQIQFNFTPYLQPGEVIIYHQIISVNTSACTCPVIVNFVNPTPLPTNSPTPTTTPTNTPTPSITPTITPTNSETPTPTVTPTNTETPTQTPSETPTNTPTITPTETPTNTPTQTSTTTPTPSITPTITSTPTPTPTPSTPSNKLWNTNSTNWNNETGLWNTV